VGWGGHSVPLGCQIPFSCMGMTEDKQILGMFVDCCGWGNLETKESHLI